MPVTTFAEGDLFVIRITKSLQANPDDAWANSYEFQATVAGDEGDLLTLANILVLFEANFHHDDVIFQRALISTWEPDSVPYDPATFISSTLTATGAIGLSSPLVALNTCLTVVRNVPSGRVGHLFYRGVLDQSEVEAPAGKYVLVSRPSQQGKIDDGMDASGLDDYLGAGPTASLRMVMINADGTQIRNVINLRAQGVTTLPTDHAWFNRTTGP